MFDFIPLNFYTAIYYHVMMFLTLITLFHAVQNDLFAAGTKSFARGLGFILLIFIITYMGTRPISGYYFGDMGTYASYFNRIASGEKLGIKNDYVFNYFMHFCTRIMNVQSFFLLCAFLYILPCYLFSRKYFGSYWYFGLLVFIGSYMFWPFGTNGIRNGLATSIFVWAMCFYQRKLIMYAMMVLAIGMHSSLIIPIAGFAVAGLYKNPKAYLYIWLAAIPLSLAGGGFWENLFAGLGFGGDARATDYLTKGNVNNDEFSSTGFRWDFLFYSSFAAFAGWYFIFKKKVTDQFYIHLWGTYMIANAFWILVIRANFSNRFAYLSWFLMAPIIAYPMLRYKIFPNQYRTVGVVITIYYLFTYFMFLKG